MWAWSPTTTRSPRWVWAATATRLPMVPLATKRPASLPTASAARRSRRLTVGSSEKTSSPTSASNMAWRMAGVGRVMVSLRRSMVFTVRSFCRCRRDAAARTLAISPDPAAADPSRLALPQGLIAAAAANGGEDLGLLLLEQLLESRLAAVGHLGVAETHQAVHDALPDAGLLQEGDVARPHERHDAFGQGKAGAQLLQVAESLFHGPGLGYQLDEGPFLVVVAGVHQQALFDNREAHHQDLRRVYDVHEGPLIKLV